jgi:hypothetical protein
MFLQFPNVFENASFLFWKRLASVVQALNFEINSQMWKKKVISKGHFKLHGLYLAVFNRNDFQINVSFES